MIRIEKNAQTPNKTLQNMQIITRQKRQLTLKQLNMKNKLFLLISFATLVGCTSNKNFMLAPDIYILDKDDPIESFEDLTNKFQGKPIYIDRWATWCTPCIKEFKHNEALHNFLQKNEIEIVYLNSDTDLNEEKWFEFIIDHNLKGNHLRLDSILKADLIDKGIFIPMIPQYMIVGKDGEMIENSALRPSDGDELYNQLKEILKL